MEQITGLAWMTGHPEDQPRIQRGPCDPNGGLHAAFAALVALERRDRTGVGCLVEAPMFEAALNVAAEPVLEWTAHQRLVEREGNRSPAAAPQDLVATDAPERWLAVSCATTEQFAALAKVIGRPELADDPELATLAGRRRHHDRLTDAIATWAATKDRDAAVDELLAAGVPAAPCTDSRRTSDHEQMGARGYYEAVEHPVVGTQPTPGLPFRYASVERWIRRPAPTIGQHNVEVLGGWLGHDPDELAALTEQGVIGTWPAGA
jgi:crotonobetainyl-CoA:carnitine CoA-transferase CaiB-like acyl-CoA transferase